MIDLDQIVESFKLNIPKIEPDRLAEIVGLLDAVPKARLNQILDRIVSEAEAHPEETVGKFFKASVLDTVGRIRKEIQKTV